VGGVGLEPNVGNPGDLLVLLEVSSESERVFGMALRTKRKRLQTLQEEERGERVECSAQIAQNF
jgi:hypothetical protein